MNVNFSLIFKPNEMKIHIRRSKKEDAARMMELIRELAAFEKEPDEVTVSSEHFIETGFGNHPVWNAFVIEVEDETNSKTEIAGFALYYTRYSTWKGKRLYLEDIIITEKMRGKGLGKLLFDRLISEAKENGFTGMTWQVLDWNEPAIRFYKKYNATLTPGWLNGNINF